MAKAELKQTVKLFKDEDFTGIQAELIEETGFCTFFKNGLCTIHDAGLKPTEGKLSHHSTKIDNFKVNKSISWQIAKEWIDPKNNATIQRIKEKLNARA